MPWESRLLALVQREVSSSDIDGLLRGSGQLEDLRQAIEDKRRAGELRHPGRPWETHQEFGPSLALFWVAQAFIAIARSLKEEDEKVDPATSGFMPRLSHDQALALLHQVGDYLALTSATLADPSGPLGYPLPIPLQPRFDSGGRCPVAHLQGILVATEYLHEKAAVEVESYVAAIAAAEHVPPEVAALAPRLTSQLAAAQSRLAMAKGSVLPILNRQPVDMRLHEEAENNLWASLSTYVELGQIIALPALLDRTAPSGRPNPSGGRDPVAPPPCCPGAPRRISADERWCLTDEAAYRELRAEGRLGWAADELAEFWARRHDTLSAEEQQFLAETQVLQRQGALAGDSYLLHCPFNTIWTVRAPVTLLGRSLPPGGQVAYNYYDGTGGLVTTFTAGSDFTECPDER